MKHLSFYIAFLFLSNTLYSQGNHRIKFNDSISFSLKETVFLKSTHSLLFNQNKKVLFLIDSLPVYGTDGEIPDSTLNELLFVVGGNAYSLDVSSMYNPNLKYLSLDKISVCNFMGYYIIRIIFGFGAGAYGVEWQVTNGVVYRTIITNDIEIIDEHFLNENCLVFGKD